MPAAVGGTPARVMSSASSCSPMRTCRSSSSTTTTEPAPDALHHARARSRGVASAGSSASATSRRSATPIAGRPQPLHQAGRRAAEPGVGHSAVRSPSSARTASGQAGHGEHAGRSAALSRTGSTSVVPAGRPPHAGGRGRPHRVAGGGHVQLGQHVLEVDRGDRVHQPAGQRGADRGRPAAVRCAPASQCGTRTSAPGSPAGSALNRARPGRRQPARARRRRPGRRRGRARCHVVDIGSGGPRSTRSRHPFRDPSPRRPRVPPVSRPSRRCRPPLMIRSPDRQGSSLSRRRRGRTRNPEVGRRYARIRRHRRRRPARRSDGAKAAGPDRGAASSLPIRAAIPARPSSEIVVHDADDADAGARIRSSRRFSFHSTSPGEEA